LHAEAFSFVATVTDGRTFGAVLDIGGRNVNGSVRGLFSCDEYLALDIAPGDGVDIVADAADWTPTRTFDAVVCCEVFEHTPRWPEILKTIAAALDVGGTAIITAAADPRAPHSAIDGGPLRAGEYYGNVDPALLAKEMAAAGFSGRIAGNEAHGDVYALAVRER
jgi:hypothetical protein